MWESFNYYSGGGIQGVDGQRQTVLDEQVGLVSPRGRPSQPTLERPEIPLAWPAGEPSVTFEMQRKTHMYSRMAVPTLLLALQVSPMAVMGCRGVVALRGSQ